MNLLCGALANWFEQIYFKYVKNLSDKTKVTVGVICLVVSMIVFVLCTKGHDKANMVNSWFLFFLSLIIFGVGVFYLTFA